MKNVENFGRICTKNKRCFTKSSFTVSTGQKVFKIGPKKLSTCENTEKIDIKREKMLFQKDLYKKTRQVRKQPQNWIKIIPTILKK